MVADDLDVGSEASRRAALARGGLLAGPRKRTLRNPRTAPRPDPYTYLRCWEGRVFFAFIIDVYSRMTVGWQIADHMCTDVVLDALRMALHLRGHGADVQLVCHSDAGQYVSND